MFLTTHKFLGFALILTAICLNGSRSAFADDTLVLTRMNAFTLLCTEDQPCTRELEDIIITVPLQENTDQTQSGTFYDFSHLPNGDLFSYSFTVVESLNPRKPSVEITQTCKLETLNGEMIFECPTVTHKAKTRRAVLPQFYEQEIKTKKNRYFMHISYQSAED